MNSFESSRLEYATQREAEELYGPVQAACREVLATLLTVRSEITNNGVEHTSADLVELTRIAFAQAWRPRREPPFPTD
jgi:hypothetical protein